MKVDVEKVHLPPFQIREEIDQEHVEEIKESFREDGQWNPIIIRPSEKEDGTYEVVSGAHRLQAAKDLGWSEIDANVKTSLKRTPAVWLSRPTGCRRR